DSPEAGGSEPGRPDESRCHDFHAHTANDQAAETRGYFHSPVIPTHPLCPTLHADGLVDRVIDLPTLGPRSYGGERIDDVHGGGSNRTGDGVEPVVFFLRSLSPVLQIGLSRTLLQGAPSLIPEAWSKESPTPAGDLLGDPIKIDHFILPRLIPPGIRVRLAFE